MKHDSYFYDRAEQELEFAQSANHPSAVKAHYILAGYYLDRFYGTEAGCSAAPFEAITRNIKG
jgi:hypothetical protein